MILLQEMFKKHHQNLCFFIRGACFYHEKVRTLDYKGVRTGILCGFEFYRTAIILMLTIVEELSTEEISQILRIKPSSVRSQFCRAKQKLVKLYRNE